jgi:uncharacterized protein YndB with AHSA1/START domain
MSATDGPKATRQVGKLAIREISDHEVEITRVFDAARGLVWEAISKPEHLTRWWGPRRSTMVSCHLDFRSGGSFRFVLRGPDGNEHAFWGEIREVVPPERVVRTFEMGMPGAGLIETWTLTERDGKTTLRVISAVASPEVLQRILKSGFAAGAATGYDRLEEYLQTLT